MLLGTAADYEEIIKTFYYVFHIMVILFKLEISLMICGYYRIIIIFNITFSPYKFLPFLHYNMNN